MNIYTQICGLVIIAMLLFFYKRQPTMGLGSEQKFITTLYAILICTILDITSCYFIVNAARFETFLVILICKLYLLSLQTVAFFALRYAVSDIITVYGSKTEKFVKQLYDVLFTLGVLATLYLDLDTYYDGQSLYSFGPAALVTFGMVGIYMLTVFASTYILRKHIKQQKIYALRFWMVIWMVSAAIQYVRPKYLVVSFAACIGALVMYFELENPQGAISRRTGHFSSAVIRDYLDHMYQNRQAFSAMMISFRTVADASNESKLLRTTIEMLSEFLFTIDGAKVFDTAEGYFLLIFENAGLMESTKAKITDYFQSVEDSKDAINAITLLNPYYTIVPNCSIAENADEFMMLLTSFIPSNHAAVSKNEVVVNIDTMAQLRHRKQVEKMVVEAMEEDRIEVHYQPIYNIAQGTFTSAEALVRIRLSDGTLVFPNDFIPIVEETGRIIPLSDGIYKKAFSFIKSYRVEKLGVNTIELNLSVKQGESKVFVSRFVEMLKSHDISPELINLEITETSSLNSPDSLLSNMQKLEEHGISFSLDDFGTGNSNLNYIIDMPVDIVKLDKHLTDEYFRNKRAQAIVKTIIEMSHSMGIKIVAEGIETVDELEAMKTLGVDYIQGYYFSRPLPEHEFLKFIQMKNLG